MKGPAFPQAWQTATQNFLSLQTRPDKDTRPPQNQNTHQFAQQYHQCYFNHTLSHSSSSYHRHIMVIVNTGSTARVTNDNNAKPFFLKLVWIGIPAIVYHPERFRSNTISREILVNDEASSPSSSRGSEIIGTS